MPSHSWRTTISTKSDVDNDIWESPPALISRCTLFFSAANTSDRFISCHFIYPVDKLYSFRHETFSTKKVRTFFGSKVAGYCMHILSWLLVNESKLKCRENTIVHERYSVIPLHDGTRIFQSWDLPIMISNESCNVCKDPVCFACHQKTQTTTAATTRVKQIFT